MLLEQPQRSPALPLEEIIQEILLAESSNEYSMLLYQRDNSDLEKEAQLKAIIDDLFDKIKYKDKDVVYAYANAHIELMELFDYARDKNKNVKNFIFSKIEEIIGKLTTKKFNINKKANRSNSAYIKLENVSIGSQNQKVAHSSLQKSRIYSPNSKNWNSKKQFQKHDQIKNSIPNICKGMLVSNARINELKLKEIQSNKTLSKESQKLKEKALLGTRIGQLREKIERHKVKLKIGSKKENLTKSSFNNKNKKKQTIAMLETTFSKKKISIIQMDPYTTEEQGNNQSKEDEFMKTEIDFLTKVVNNDEANKRLEQSIHFPREKVDPHKERSFLDFSRTTFLPKDQVQRTFGLNNRQIGLKRMFQQQYENIVIESSKKMVEKGRVNELNEITEAFRQKCALESIKKQYHRSKFTHIKSKDLLLRIGGEFNNRLSKNQASSIAINSVGKFGYSQKMMKSAKSPSIKFSREHPLSVKFSKLNQQKIGSENQSQKSDSMKESPVRVNRAFTFQS